MPRKKNGLVLALTAVAFCATILLQNVADPLRVQFEPRTKGLMTKVTGLPTEYIFGTLLGFREVVAGALWVRADEFFHEGNYDAILPIIRLVTWLDNHNLDAYSTGAWHIGYNFTDTEQRSDRRYLGTSIHLLEEAVENNPNVYDMYFETGWMWFDKVKMAEFAVPWFQKANDFPDRKSENDPGIPPARRHMLPHSWERAGQPLQCALAWGQVIKQHRESPVGDPKDYVYGSMLGTALRNYTLTQTRQYNRYDKPNPDTVPSIDTKFDAQVKVIGVKKIEVVGSMDLGTYHDDKLDRITTHTGRIHITMRQEDYHNMLLPDSDPKADHVWKKGPFNLDLPDIFIMQDMTSVMDGKFKRKMDMSQDPMMYNFKPEKYIVTVRFCPLYAPASTQDRIGWCGEGLKDKNMITETITTKDRNGKVYTAKVNRVIKRFELTREQLLSGQGTARPL